MRTQPDTRLLPGRRRSRGLRVLAGSLACVALVAAAAAPGQAHRVTLQLGQSRNANGVLVMVFSGRVASGSSGEVVEVVGQDCGTRGYRLITSARSQVGGVWRAENPKQEFPWSYTPVGSGIAYRARWGDAESAPVVYRTPAPLGVARIARRQAWRVYTSPPPPGTVSMRGKVVELQRRTGGRWSTIRRARLALRPHLRYGAFNHQVVFQVPQRGWTLRAALPPASAAPRYLAAVSSTWRS